MMNIQYFHNMAAAVADVIWVKKDQIQLEKIAFESIRNGLKSFLNECVH